METSGVMPVGMTWGWKWGADGLKRGAALPGLGDCNPRRPQCVSIRVSPGVCVHTQTLVRRVGGLGDQLCPILFWVYRGTVARTPGMQHSKSAFVGSPCAYTGDLDVYIPLGLQCRLCGNYFPQFSLCSMGGLAYAGLHHWWHPLGPLMECRCTTGEEKN